MTIDIFVTLVSIAHYLNGVYAVVKIGHGNGLFSEGTVLLAALRDGDGGIDSQLANHLGTVLVTTDVVAHDKGVLFHFLLDGIGRINHRQVLREDGLVIVVVATLDSDTLHLVFQRRQHGREFTCLLVGRYEDVIGVVFVFLVADDAARAISCAIDAVGGALDGDVCRSERAVAVVVNDVVERALRLFAEAELDGGLAYAVFAAMEANGLVLVGETAVDTARDVDQCGVDKVDNLRAFEVIFAAVKRERREAVAVHVALDKVFADRNAYLVFAIGIAANALFRLY